MFRKYVISIRIVRIIFVTKWRKQKIADQKLAAQIKKDPSVWVWYPKRSTSTLVAFAVAIR